MITLGVLVSGSGTNLQAILDAIDARKLDARIGVVISNVSNARALERARAANVAEVVLEHGRFGDRAAFDAALVEILSAHEVDVVVLAGFMRLLTPIVLDAFPWRVVNVHPALLPAFPGIRAQKQALDYGVRIAGCTVHLVDHGTDTGPIVAQAAIAVDENDDEESLRERILACEHELLPRVLQWLAEGRISVEVSESEGADENAALRKRARVRVRGVRTAMGLEAR